MKIELDKVAAISYKLTITNDPNGPKVIETVDEKHPMYFLVGSSGLPPKFELNLAGKTKGDSFSFEIKASDAFGSYDLNELMNLPIDEFLDDNKKLDTEVFKVGSVVPMVDEHGHHVRGRILEINQFERYIRMDFNHPLAGKDLKFEGNVVLVRDATKEELSHGHVHGEGGHHH